MLFSPRHFALLCATVSACILLPVAGVQAQSPLGGAKSKEPVEITANDAIEWMRNDHVYRARGAAQAKQGDVTINADLLEASYDPAVGEQDIQTVTAIGNVKIVNADRDIVADKGVYDLKTGLLTLTGQNIKLTSPDATVTAQDKVTYNSTTNQASAVGNAVIVTPERTLRAQQIDAWFTSNSDKAENSKTGNLQRATARGNVMIKTAKEILQADNADYNVTTQQAVMTGNVRLTQGENHLQGARAVVNLKTGVSQLFGDTNPNNIAPASGGGRVKAIFFPGTKNNSPMPTQATGAMIPMRPAKPKSGETP